MKREKMQKSALIIIDLQAFIKKLAKMLSLMVGIKLSRIIEL